ncbi:hypothetical protein E2562_037332 [Oryza meyeriana var. granulata]|uniref:Uncharacterized protein n=1 Tax=Oryza meyeriana var. granulata TaxID=110450 RepID=A0A6G1ETP8_9ORYZ|nr:hypothetical protein E2562_037332 [Oryza meyeriana var. granulata]
MEAQPWRGEGGRDSEPAPWIRAEGSNEGVLPSVARGAVANKGGTVVMAVMPKQAKSEGKGAMSNGLEKAAEYQYSPVAAQHKSAAAAGFSFRLQEPAEKEESSSAWAVLGEWPTWDCNH